MDSFNPITEESLISALLAEADTIAPIAEAETTAPTASTAETNAAFIPWNNQNNTLQQDMVAGISTGIATNDKKRVKVAPDMFNDITLDDIIVDTTSGIPVVVSMKGLTFKEILQPAYRSIAKTFKLPWKNASKEAIFLSIATLKHNTAIYANQEAERDYNNLLRRTTGTEYIDDDDDVDEGEVEQLVTDNPVPLTLLANTKTTKTRHCPFLLLNVLFSSNFAERLVRLGDPVSKDVLTAGKGRHNQPFWELVRVACTNTTRGYGVMLFPHHLFEESNIDPSKSHAINHSWVKWREIYNNIISFYKKCDANFRKSGTHDSNFESFIMNRNDVLYLYFHLQEKPHLIEAVTEMLPEGAQMDSEIIFNDNYNATPAPNNNKRRASPTASMAGAITQFSEQGNNIQEQKIKLLKEELELSNKRQMIDEERLDLEKKQFAIDQKKSEAEMKRVEAENQRMHDNHQQYLTDQFTLLTQQIIGLRKQLNEEPLNESKSEIEGLMKVILKQKKEIESQL